MKSFRDFIQEARKKSAGRSREDAEAMRQAKDNPDDWYLNNSKSTENPNWRLKPKSQGKGERERRASVMKSLKLSDFEDYGKRNLLPNYKKTAKSALKIERGRKKEQESERKTKSTESGEQFDVDHIMGQMNRKKHTGRWHKVHPGDASDNRRVISQKENLKKNSKDTTEKKITRAQAIRLAWERGVSQQNQNNQSKKREHADIVRDNRA
tara:strand:- start:11 stop:640 length:630 start_codon:yes stop_codon:yes gene_type:complete